MRKLKSLFFVALLICSLSSNAQLAKGNLMLGGLMSASGGSGVFNFGLYPSCGYFISNKAVLGGALDLSLSRGKYESSFFGLSMMGRYYFSDSIAKLPIFVQGKVGAARASSNVDATIFGSLGLGFDYFITSSVALEASAGINIDNTGFSNVYAMLGFQIFLPSSVYSKK